MVWDIQALQAAVLRCTFGLAPREHSMLPRFITHMPVTLPSDPSVQHRGQHLLQERHPHRHRP
jgi:hypothetical protein